MRILVLAAFALAACSGVTPAQEVIGAEHRWMAAMAARNGPVLDTLLAPEFTLAGLEASDRPPVPRAVWIDNALRHLKVDRVGFESEQVEARGDRATYTATFRWKGAYDGEAFDDRVRLVDVWVRRDGRWQVASRRVGDLMPAP